MPSRMLDFPAMWGSDKLAACAEWAQAEYAWLYGLADAHGSFELTNIRVLWFRVAAIRKSLSVERLEQIFDEFHDKGLLFTWTHDGKRYGHWTGSDRKGRLPAKSLRKRYSRLAPPVPKKELQEYVSKFSKSVLSQSRSYPDRIEDGLKGDRNKPSCSSPSAPQEGFEAFWSKYPRKENRAKTSKLWAKLSPEDRQAAIAGVERAGRSEQWQKEGGRFVPLSTTFLNGRRWEDELPAVTNRIAPADSSEGIVRLDAEEVPV